MFDWLADFLEAAGRLVPDPVKDVVQWSLEGIGGILGTVTNDVADAWHELAVGLDALRAGHDSFATDLLTTLGNIIGHWIPKYAITAWWWVTHPDQFAEQLVLYIVKWLERMAWTIGPYLGEFLLALIVRNIRRWLPILGHIIGAIL